jgi:signal transduction histidine kinase
VRETLSDSYGEVIPEVDEDLAEMVVQSNRMDRLLTDLLTYARIGQSGEFWEVVDPVPVIEDSIPLAGLPDGFQVEIRSPLPRVRCIPTELALIVRNLITNAVKHHDRDTGRIVISGRRCGDTAIIEVRDDGPGIERAYATRVFEMFSTLKPRDQVEGSGMGLAMVKKIVERAGGYVRLGGSDDARGAVFELTFPAPGDCDSNQGETECSRSCSRKTVTSRCAISVASLPCGTSLTN